MDAWDSTSDYVKGSEAICVCSWEQTWTFGSSEVNFLCENDCTENIA